MDPIYLDYAATTPVRDEVRAAMEPYLWEDFGNPSSTHRWGRRAQAALEEARATVAEALGARRREVVFVRGGTESDNLALLGRVDADRRAGRTPHLITTAVEHKAVLDTAHAAEAAGARCTILPVDAGGAVSLDALDDALRGGASLVSAMWVNNEVGTVQPMEALAARARAVGVPVHTDAVQAVGKLPVRVDQVPVDLLSVTGHKIYGPKSTGALFVRDGVELVSRLHGGSQEGGLRPGTQDVAGAVGLAAALRLAVEEQASFAASRRPLRDELEARLLAGIPGLVVHGAPGVRAPHILSVGIPGVDPELLQVSLDMEGLAVSGGSACTSGSTSLSHVLEAMLGPGTPPAVIRYSLGRATTREEVLGAAEVTLGVVERLGGPP
ncbi:MAG TPA: cysteine desulfurase family protein [Longimicrobiales bacterium]|nr:cysteine desulfurase family protein [Longimicrobiales bacterium]